jgi:hypothetical protein
MEHVINWKANVNAKNHTVDTVARSCHVLTSVVELVFVKMMGNVNVTKVSLATIAPQESVSITAVTTVSVKTAHVFVKKDGLVLTVVTRDVKKTVTTTVLARTIHVSVSKVSVEIFAKLRIVLTIVMVTEFVLMELVNASEDGMENLAKNMNAHQKTNTNVVDTVSVLLEIATVLDTSTPHSMLSFVIPGMIAT